MSARKRILVTTGLWQGALCCMESLGRLGHQIYLINERAHEASANSKYCTESLFCPLDEHSDDFVQFVIDICREKQIDCVIPISDAATASLSVHYQALSTLTACVLPGAENARLANDKAATYRLAMQHDIDIPRTWFPHSAEDITAIAHQVGFPCVIKVPDGVSAAGVYIEQDSDALARRFADLHAAGVMPIVQEFINGDLYGFTAVCRQGEVLAHFAFRTDIEYTLGGTPPLAYSVNDEQFLAQARRLIALTNWTGAIDLDYLVDDTGRHRLLEINPRLSGTSIFAYKLGIDLPASYLSLALGQAPTPSDRPYPNNVLFRSPVSVELPRCLEDRRYTGQFVRNFFRFPQRTNVFWGDLGVTWAELRNLRWRYSK